MVQALAVRLLHELALGQASEWFLYLRQLPKTYSTACMFTSGQAAQLQVSLPSLHERAICMQGHDAKCGMICLRLSSPHKLIDPSRSVDKSLQDTQNLLCGML